MSTLRLLTLLSGTLLTLTVSAVEGVDEPRAAISNLPTLDSFLLDGVERDYGLRFTPYISFDVKLNDQHQPSASVSIDDLNYWQEYSVDAFFIQVNASVSITQRNEVYAAFGTNETDLIAEPQESLFIRDDISSWGGALGWRYRFNQNWSTNLDYQHVERSDVDLSTVNFGVIYSF